MNAAEWKKAYGTDADKRRTFGQPTGGTTNVTSPIVDPESIVSLKEFKERQSATPAAQNATPGFVPKVPTTAPYSQSENRVKTAGQTLNDPKTGLQAPYLGTPQKQEAENFWQMANRYISGSQGFDIDTGEMSRNAASEFQARNALISPVEHIRGIANQASYLAQGGARANLADAQAGLSAVDAILGTDNAKKTGDMLKEVQEAGLRTPFHWGEKFKQETEANYNPTKFERVMSDVLSGATGMIPAIVANIFVPGSSLFVMASGAAGNATQEALESGADEGGAVMYGVSVGVIEALTEKLFDGVSGLFGKGLADDAIESLVKSKLKNETAQQAVIKVLSMLGEGAEEFVAEVTENWVNRVTADTDMRRGKELWGDSVYSFWVGGLVSALMQTANLGGRRPSAEEVAQLAVENAKAEARTTAVNDNPNTQARRAPKRDAAFMEAEKRNIGKVAEEMRAGGQTAGAYVLENFYDGSIPAPDFYNDFIKAYELGRNGGELGEAKAGVINAPTRQAAYEAGASDAARDVRLANENKESFSLTTDEGSGKIDPKVQKALELIKRGATGSEIYNETGLFRANQILKDSNGNVVWRLDDGGQETVPGTGDGRMEKRETAAGISENDAGRTGGLGRQQISRGKYTDLSTEKRLKVNDAIIRGLNTKNADEISALREIYSDEDIANLFYDRYAESNLAAETMARYFNNVDGLIAELDRINSEGGNGNGNQVSDGEGRRGDGQRAGGQNRILDRRAEKADHTEQRRKADERRTASDVQGAEKVSGRRLGIKSASDEKTMTVAGDKMIAGDSELAAISADAKTRGVKVVMFTGVVKFYNGSVARGWYAEDGTVYIRIDDESATAKQIYDHEIYHSLSQETKNSVADGITAEYGGKRLTALTEWYTELYRGLDYSAEEVFEEICADAYAGINIFSDVYGAELLQDFVRERVGNAESKPNTDGGRASISPDKYYERQIEQWDGKDHGGSFRVGSPSKALRSVGVPNTDIWFDQSKAATQLLQKDEVTKDVLKDIPKLLDHPIAISESYDNTVMVFGQLFDQKGNPIVVAIRINSTNRRNHITLVNKVRSVGTRTHNLDKLLSDDDILYLGENKKETNKWFNALGRSTPFGGTKYGLIRSIRNNSEKVNGKASIIAPEEIAELERRNDEIRKKLDYLTEQNEKLKAQTRRTEGTRLTDPQKAMSLAKKLTSDVDKSAVSTEEVAKTLKEISDDIIKGNNRDIESRVYTLANSIVSNSQELASPDAQSFSDLKGYLRGSGLYLAEEYRADVDYGDIIKSHPFTFKNNGTPVDVAYAELNGMMPGYFPEYIVNPADQTARIIEVYDSLKPVYENPYSFDLNCATDYMYAEIMDEIFELPQIKPTFADTMWAKVGKARAQTRDAREAGREAVARERERRAQREKRLREYYAQRDADRRTRREESAARTKLLKIAQRLKRLKTTEANRNVINSMIGDLDTVAVSLTGKKASQLQDLLDWYMGEARNNPDFIKDERTEANLDRLKQKQIKDMNINDVRALVEALQNIENNIRLEKKLVDQTDRRDVYIQATEAIEDIRNSAGQSKSTLGRLAEKWIVPSTLSPLRMIRRLVGYKNSSPLLRRVEALADGQRAMFDYELKARNAIRRFTGDKAFMRSITGKLADTIKISGLAANGVKTVEITRGMAISLYLHSLNDQNARHMAEGGVTVPDMELYRAGKIDDAYGKGTTIKMSKFTARTLFSSFTETERDFAIAIKHYFNDTSRAAINEVSSQLKGYDIAGVENYFPINTDSSFTKGDYDTIKFDGTIEGMGFTKERQSAANPIYLRDASQVLDKAIGQHAKYVGLAIPIRDMSKLLGVSETGFAEDGAKVRYNDSIQAAVKSMWSAADWEYIEKLMGDLQSPKYNNKFWSKFFDAVRSNYAGAVLTLNASVAIKQAASYPTAGAVVGFKPLAVAMTKVGKVSLDLINAYTPLLAYRSEGFADMERGALKDRGKELPPWLNWIQAMDVVTTRKLWKVAEIYVRQNTELLPGDMEQVYSGTDPFYLEVAKVYNRIIEETQPNYSTMQRPQLLRSDETFTKNISMFKTQPFQNFNILFDAYGNLAAKKKANAAAQALDGNNRFNRIQQEQAAKELEEAGRYAANATASQFMQMLVFSGMTALWGFATGRREKYEDEEGNLTWLSFLKGLGINFAAGAAGQIPFGSEVYEGVYSLITGEKFYGMEAVSTNALNDAASATINAAKSVTKLIKGDLSVEDAIRSSVSAIEDISKTFGIPVENVNKLVQMMFGAGAKAAFGKYMGEFYVMQITISTASSYGKGKYYDLLYKAYVNDRAQYSKMRAALIETGDFKAENIDAAMKKRANN